VAGILIYDTTLRDGSQTEGVSFSVADRIGIALKLDDLGINYIEGGYPAASRKDEQFFCEIRKQRIRSAKITAFGSTRKAGTTPGRDRWIRALLKSEVSVVALVGKTWDLHVRDVLRTDLEENLRMIADSVSYMKNHDREVIFDAEHFFDGYKNNPAYARRVIETARDAGADTIALCDTNGGCLPSEIANIMVDVADALRGVTVGIHAHNDSDLATANTVTAVECGATHVQGTVNGLGERCGNADLCTIIPNLILKQNHACIPKKNLKKITEVSRYVYDVANMGFHLNQPFVGGSAFAHKGGMHVHAVQRNPLTYEHVPPELVGNERRILLSELSGSATMLAKTVKHRIRRDSPVMKKLLNEVQELENEGYQFESAEASFDLLVLKALGRYRTFFDVNEFRVIVRRTAESHLPVTEAVIEVRTDDGPYDLVAAKGDGPVNALDNAIRKALEDPYPQLREMRLVDYKVRVVNPRAGTAAKVRVNIESQDHDELWGTVGVSENLIEASWQALVDSIEYKLLKDIDR